MIRSLTFFIISMIVFCTPALGVDVEQAKQDYKDALFKVSSIRESRYENAPAISVKFTVPLSKKYLKNYHVSLKGGESEHWIISEGRSRVIFPFVSPDTEYKVTVASEIRDITGRKLGQEETKEIKTDKVKPYVGFESSGHILSSSSPKRLPVTTLNINKVDIDFFAIRKSSIPQFLKKMKQSGKKSYHQLKRIKKYGALVYSGRFELKHRKNQRTTYNIDLEEIDRLNEPGMYAAVMKQAGTYEYRCEFTYFMQTDIGLHARRYKEKFYVYAQDITTGKPMENVSISVLNKEGKVGDTGRTDQNGRVLFYNQSGRNWILAEKNEDMSVLRLDINALDLSALKNAATSHSEYQIYAWGPRDLYRPGEKVKLDILVRDHDGKSPPTMPVEYTLYKPSGDKAASGKLQPSEKGFYTFEYLTNRSSKTGKYHLKLSFAESNKASYYFQVEEFLPERMDLEIFDGPAEEKRLIPQQEMIEVPVAANYLYGAPAAGNKVDGFVTAKIDPHPFEHLPEFHFGDAEEKIQYKREKFKKINLSENGTGVLTMENKWEDIESPIRLNIEASVYESGGRPVTRRAATTLLPDRHFIGIQPQFEDNPDSNAAADIKVGCVDKDGQWMHNRSLEVSLIRMNLNWYWRHSRSLGWHWAKDETPETVLVKTVHIKDQNTARVSLPLKRGSYRVEITDGKAFSAYEFKTAGSWWKNTVSSNARKPELISLGFEKSAYRAGEEARLRIQPPQDGLALVTVESSQGVLFTKYIPVHSEGTDINIPTDKSWDRHDLYASAMVIRPGDMTETPVPTRAFGMVHLPLQRDHRIFDVKIDAPAKTEPNKSVSANIKVGSGKPLPEETKVVVSLVDVGILNITRYKTPDAAAYFFGTRRYNVDLFDNYGQVIDNLGPQTARHRFGGGFKEEVAELARGGDRPKSDVMMVSFFSDPLKPDANGEVKASFDLPNFNGQLRWMVMVFSDDRFGKTDADTKVVDKIVTQLSRPRFLANKDNSTVALDLHNKSGDMQTLSVQMTMQGALENSRKKRTVSLDDGEKQVLKFPIRAVSSSGKGKIDLHLYNKNKDIEINRNWQIGVRSPYPEVTRTDFAAIAPNSSWTPDLETKDLLPDSIRFQMTLSNKPPINFASHLRHLLCYPYGCLEQSLSSGYPWVLAVPAKVTEMGLEQQIQKKFDHEYDNEFRRKQINKAIRHVMDKRKIDGSFGLWSSDSPEQKWLTVYAAEFLYDAEKQGGSVSPEALKETLKQLRDYLRGDFPERHSRWSSDSDHYEFAFRSYAGYVLAKAGLARLSDLRRLAEQYRQKTDDDGLSWMHMAAAFRLAGDENNADRCFKQAMSERIREKRRYYGEYGSGIRDLARIYELVQRHNFDGKDLIFDLVDAVKKRRYLSTQERICLFRIALLMHRQGGNKWSASLVTDTSVQELERESAFNTLFDMEMYNRLKKVEAGPETLYANISLAGELKDPPKPQSNELSIRRKFYDTKGNPLKLDQMKSGESALVQIEITAKQRTPDGLVVDLLPAGLEIENRNLSAASMNMDNMEINGEPVEKIRNSRYIKHEEFRDDRYVAVVNIPKQGTVHLFYLVRAVTPGIYQVPPAYAEDMYRPYHFAVGKTHGKTEVFE